MKLLSLAGASLVLAGSLAYATVLTFSAQMPEIPQADEHKELMESVGHWSGTVTWIMPDGSEQTAPASETVTAHGKFFITSNFKMAMGPGMNYEGHGCHGYDPEKGKYTGTWIDNMKPHLAIMEGEYNEEKGMTIMKWEAPNMMGKLVDNHSEAKREKDSYVMHFFEEGKPSMTIEMQRATKAMEAGHDKDGADHDGADNDSEHGDK